MTAGGAVKEKAASGRSGLRMKPLYRTTRSDSLRESLISIRSALRRNKVKGIYIDIMLILIGIIFVAGFSYFTFF